MPLVVHQFACLEDNYGFLIQDQVTGKTACVDTPDAEAALANLELMGWRLDLIINTHWHRDHSGGNDELRYASGALVAGPEEVARISSPDRILGPGDILGLGETRLKVLGTGGHTLGHLSYYDPESSAVFVGDTLFAMGCGRVFEGTQEQMWESLQRLTALPPDTAVYCAHEYTEANCRFALSIDEDPAVVARAETIAERRSRNLPTVPTTIGAEIETNPFLRAPALRPALSPVAAFAEIRALKDSFHA